MATPCPGMRVWSAVRRMTGIEAGKRTVLQRKFKILVLTLRRMNIGQTNTTKLHCKKLPKLGIWKPFRFSFLLCASSFSFLKLLFLCLSDSPDLHNGQNLPTPRLPNHYRASHQKGMTIQFKILKEGFYPSLDQGPTYIQMTWLRHGGVAVPLHKEMPGAHCYVYRWGD